MTQIFTRPFSSEPEMASRKAYPVEFQTPEATRNRAHRQVPNRKEVS
jgi:hypothetical protein